MESIEIYNKELKTKQTIYLKNIVFIESVKGGSIIYMIDKSLETNKLVKDILPDLNDNFHLSHRRYIVNFQYVQQIHKGNIKLEKGYIAELSRRKYSGILNRYKLFCSDL